MSDPGLETLELRISKFLRAGVIVAGALLTAGWALGLIRGGASISSLRTYDPVPLTTDLARAYAGGDTGRLIAYAGLAALIALPFTRVLLTSVLFVRRREWALAAAAGFVTLALISSVVLGIDL